MKKHKAMKILENKGYTVVRQKKHIILKDKDGNVMTLNNDREIDELTMKKKLREIEVLKSNKEDK